MISDPCVNWISSHQFTSLHSARQAGRAKAWGRPDEYSGNATAKSNFLLCESEAQKAAKPRKEGRKEGRKEKELNTECMSSKQVSAWGFVITKTFKERLRKMKLPKKCIVALSRTVTRFCQSSNYPV